MNRLSRFRFSVYSILTVLVLLGGARLVLSSGFVANKVADRLEALLGVPVRVTGVDIALGGSSAVQGLQIYERASDDLPALPWATAEDVRVDFSAVDIFGDSMPKEVVLNGANVELRFAENGALLTRLPQASDSSKSMPKLRLENARISLLQDGREAPLVVENVNAEFTYAERSFRFDGTCVDAVWGEWTVAGSYDTVNKVFHLELHTVRAEVTAEKLALLPFVPAKVWKAVRITAGVTPVDLDLTAGGGERVKYRVQLKPENTSLRITAIDLDAEQASGAVVIENSVVRLSDVKGRTANGTIATEAVLDFSSPSADLKFPVLSVDKVELQKLPDSWGLKKFNIQGKLTGKAELFVLVKPTGVSTKGSGKGTVNVDNLPLLAPVPIKLIADKGKFRIFPTGTGLFPGL